MPGSGVCTAQRRLLALTNVGVLGQPVDLVLVLVCQAEGSVLVLTFGEPVGLHFCGEDREAIPGIQCSIVAICIDPCRVGEQPQAEHA